MLEYDDIQGNILAGFNTWIEVFVALTREPEADAAAASDWLGGLAPRLSTVADVRGTRKAVKSAVAGGPVWLAVAVGPDIIRAALGVVPVDDGLYRRGMALTASALGDDTDPADWVVGGPGRDVDALLVVASNVAADAEAEADRLAAGARAAGFAVSYRETGYRLDGDAEHFGFRDGISQPAVRGDRSTTGLGPGHFVFGYPKIDGGTPVDNNLDRVGFGRNGSLVAFRRLAQNVEQFRAECAAEAARLSPQWPGLTPEWVQALVVGRWPSGAPVSTRSGTDPGEPAGDNAFDFGDDFGGVRCPFAAHVRKVNPREGVGDAVDVPRLLRRGIPFGQPFPFPAERGRGLLFVAYQTSLKDQFVFLSNTWMNDPDRPQAGGGPDLLVGRTGKPREMPVIGPQGPVRIVAGVDHWITPTGGAYLFAPGRKGLSMLSRAPVI